jgi:membrane protein required for colicin V production
MGVVDIILLVLLAIGGYRGFKQGLIVSLIAILAFVLAIVGGFELLHIGMRYLESAYDGFGWLLPVVAFLIIFILIVVVVNLLGRAVKKLIDWTPLGWFDGIAGAALGILKWALGLSILIWFVETAGISIPHTDDGEAVIYTLVAGVAPAVWDWLTDLLPSLSHFYEYFTLLFERLRA